VPLLVGYWRHSTCGFDLGNVRAAMMKVMRDDAGDLTEEPEAFDRKVAEVLDAEAGMLREVSELLLATR
jgi:hypothetical protein